MYKRKPTPSLFRACHLLKVHKEKGWWYFSPRAGFKLVSGSPSSIHGWKEKFFFVRSPEPWEFGTTWDEPRQDLNRGVKLAKGEEDLLKFLKGCGAPKLDTLLEEDALSNVGLSPADPIVVKAMKADANLLYKSLKRREGGGPSGAAPKKKAVRKKSAASVSGATQAGPSAPATGEVRAPAPVGPEPSRVDPETDFPQNVNGEEVVVEAEVGLVRKRKPEGSADPSHKKKKKKGRSRSSSVPRTPGSGEPHVNEEPVVREIASPGAALPAVLQPPPSSVEGATARRVSQTPARDPDSPEVTCPEGQAVYLEPRLDRSPLVLPRKDEGGLKALRGESSFHNPRIARKVARHIQLPKDRDEMCALTVNELTDQAVVNSMRHLHEVIHLHDLIHTYSSHFSKLRASLRQSEEKMKEASTALREIRRSYEASRLREVDLRSALDRARHNEEDAQARAEVAADQLERAQETIKELKVENASVKEHFSELSSALADAKSRLSTQTAEVQRLEEHGTDAEIRVSTAEARASDLEDECLILRQQLSDTRQQLEEAEVINDDLESRLVSLTAVGDGHAVSEDDLKEAMKGYIASEEFQLELGECAADGFHQGFDECARQVKEIVPELDLGQLKKVLPGGGDEEEEEEEGEIGEEEEEGKPDE